MSLQFTVPSLRRLLLLAGVGVLLYANPALTLAQDAERMQRIERHQAMQQRVRDLEMSLGRHDPALVENLVSLANAAAALNLHGEASTVLERAIQIQRLNLGLFTAEQIPLYFSMLDSLVHTGDWDVINSALDYVNWLVLDKQVSDEVDTVNQLIRLSEFHLLSVAGDAVERQATHYRRGAELLFLALNISEIAWGRHDPRRIDLHYSLAKHFYLQSAAVERGGETGYALRAIVPGSSWVRPRRVVQARIYRAGLRLFRDMRELLLESEEANAEAVAMVDLYIADWHLLFNQERAEAAYREAFTALAEAGGEPAEINRLFARPQILPIAEFYPTIEEALAAMSGITPDDTALPVPEVADVQLSFQEWFEAMPVVPFPIIAPALGQFTRAEHYDTWLHFRLDSLNKVSRWVQGTYESHIGVVDEFDVVGDEDGEDIDLEYLDDRLHSLRFRPRLEDGIARPSEGILLFRAARDVAASAR